MDRKWGWIRGGCQFDADYKAAFWEARGSPILQPAAMKIYGKNNPCIHDRIIVLVFKEATGSPLRLAVFNVLCFYN